MIDKDTKKSATSDGSWQRPTLSRIRLDQTAGSGGDNKTTPLSDAGDEGVPTAGG